MSFMIRRLWLSFSRHRRAQFGLLFFLMLIASLAEMISIGAVLPFLGALTSPEKLFNNNLIQPLKAVFGIYEPRQLLLPLVIAFILASVLSGLTRLFLLWAQTTLGHAVGADLSIEIYRRTLYQPYAIHVGRNTSEIISGISNKANLVVYYVVLPLLTIFSSALILVAILLTMIAIEPSVALSTFFGFGVIYVLVVFATKKRLTLNGQIIGKDSSLAIKTLQEGFGAIRDILIDGTQEVYCKIYSDVDIPLRRAMAVVQILGGAPRFIIETLGMILVASVAFWLSIRSEGALAAIPVLGTLALGAQRLLPLLQQTYSSWTLLKSGQPSLVDVLALMDQRLPKNLFLTTPKLLPFCNAIELKDLGFRYDLNQPWVFEGVDLKINRGSRVGFIGATGSGKSTLLDILMGLLTPTCGQIKVDGIVISEENCRGWQAHISHVPQSIYLADTTIAENIAFGVPIENIDMDAVHFAAKRAQLSYVIEAWADGYKTLVGERGVRLSGGQRQRIGIARALYKRADVIFLDEATSALDNETEESVMSAIEGMGKEVTVIMVAHRLTTLKNCTQVIEMASGRIARVGSYEDIVGSTVQGF